MLTWHNIRTIVRKSFLYFLTNDDRRAQPSTLIFLYNTVLNDDLNVVLVLSCNVDLAQQWKHCKKSFLYI